MLCFSALKVMAHFSILNAREFEVMHWINSRKTNQEIEVILCISLSAVKSHLKGVFEKLNIKMRAQAVALMSNQQIGKSIL